MAKAAADKQAGVMSRKGKAQSRFSAPGGRITSGRISGRAAPMATSAISGVQCAVPGGNTTVPGGTTNVIRPQPPGSPRDEAALLAVHDTHQSYSVQPVVTHHHSETIPFFPPLEPSPGAGIRRSARHYHAKHGRRGSKGGGHSGRRASAHQMPSDTGPDVPHHVSDASKGATSAPYGGSTRDNSKTNASDHVGAYYGGSSRDASKAADGARYGRRAVRESARKREFVTKLDEPDAVAQRPAVIASSEIMPSLPFDQIDQLLRGALMNRQSLAI